MPSIEEMLTYRGRTLRLARLDGDRRPWNAADRHVLTHLEEHPPEGSVLVIDDAQGALTVALHEHRPTYLGDSVLAQRTTLHNLSTASLDPDHVNFLPATAALERHIDGAGTPDSAVGRGAITEGQVAGAEIAGAEIAGAEIADANVSRSSMTGGRATGGGIAAGGIVVPGVPFGLVLLHIPRSMALLRFYLNIIKPMIGPGTRVAGFGMTRHLSPNLRSLLAEELGPVKVSPVRQKSVLFHIQPEKFEVDPSALAPERYVLTRDVVLEMDGVEIWSYPGVFSQRRLDMGTRLLLANLPTAPPGATIVDLGCGAGTLGLAMARRKPDAKVILVDDSFLAARSAQQTLRHNGVIAEVRADDGLSSFEAGSIDVIVSNPPIHDGGAYEVEASLRLLRQAATVLRKPDPSAGSLGTRPGSLRVVAVHGADLGTRLREIFPRVSRVASDRRFAVWSASF